MSNTHRILGPLVSVLILGLLPGPAHAVLNGTEGGGSPESVYLVGGLGGVGTAWTARYPRCMVTADHILPTTVLRDGETQNIAGNMARPTASDPRNAFNDVRIIWPTNFQGAGRLDLTGTEPLEVRPDATTAIAVPAVVLGPGNPIPWANYTTRAPLLVEGYGLSNANPASAATLRFGEFSAIGRANGLAAGRDDGSAWLFSSDNGYGICTGDSGGPLYNSLGQVIGVVMGSGNPTCDPAPTDASGSYATNGHQGFAVGFSAEAAGDALSTWDWLDLGIELVCGKQLRVDTVGEGRVVGDRTGSEVRSFEDRPVLNAEIDCAWDDSTDDCMDVLHFEETLALTAEPADGWAFDEWWSGDDGDCPCDGSDDPTCTVDEGDVGMYSATQSYDHGSCIAVFVCEIDEDGDGVPACEDCDDTDPLVGAEGPELCDGIDNDCDGSVDEEGDYEMNRDADGDGFGDPADVAWFCDSEPGWVEDDTDCDDTDPDIHPQAYELCNGLDDDCDETIDEEAIDGAPYYPDADDDGYGHWDPAGEACSPPPGHVQDDTDCDDADSLVHPAASELCDGLDDDCDFEVDEGGACGLTSGEGGEYDPADDPTWDDYGWDPTNDASTEEASCGTDANPTPCDYVFEDTTYGYGDDAGYDAASGGW